MHVIFYQKVPYNPNKKIKKPFDVRTLKEKPYQER